jgi:hypothetical protein
MNHYFVDNPDMILGEMREVSGPFGPETACIAYSEQDLADQLSDAISNIHAEITEYELDDLIEEDEESSIPADPDVRNFSYTTVDGKIYYSENSRMMPVDVSVIGFDGIELASYITPSLATMRQPVEEIAKTSVSLLIDSIAGKPSRHVLLDTEPVAGDSVRSF